MRKEKAVMSRKEGQEEAVIRDSEGYYFAAKKKGSRIELFEEARKFIKGVELTGKPERGKKNPKLLKYQATIIKSSSPKATAR